MKDIYIIFDKLPKKVDGGLVETYARFVEEFEDDFNIKLVSIFENGESDIEAFKLIPQITLSKVNIDNRFYKAISYLMHGEIRKCLWAILSAFWYFMFIPISKAKTRRSLKKKIVIASSPAAAMFLSKKIDYILEIHINYEYFWGSSLLGRSQVALIPKPKLILFRNKTDADKGKDRFTCSYIYNGFNASSLSAPSFKEHLTHSALFVGRLEPQKNPLLLLKIAKEVHEVIPNFSLDIYGTGSLEKTLQKEILNDNLSDYVFLKGFCEDKSIYSKYDQTWLTSNYEGFGLVLTESMANGTPVVSTNWGDAVYEIVRDEKTGFIVRDEVEFVKKAIQLSSDVHLRNAMGKNAYKDFCQRFSAEKNKERWIGLIRETFEGHN